MWFGNDLLVQQWRNVMHSVLFKALTLFQGFFVFFTILGLSYDSVSIQVHAQP